MSAGTTMTTSTRRPADLIAGIAILAVVAAYIGFGLRTASTTLGCDFLAYYNAAVHWVQHAPIYDLTVTSTGICGIYQYPPTFVLLATPFSFFGFDLGTWLWIAFLIGCWALGTAILPVRSATKWVVLLLGAIGWPLIFGVRIGHVTPILYLVFAVAWRNVDRPLPLGASVAIGALLKLQPGLLAVWLLAQREWRALAYAIVTGLIIAGAAAAVGLGDWLGLLTLLRSLTDAITASANVAIGATLHNSFGVGIGLAGAIQNIALVVVVVVSIIAALRLPRVPGLLAMIVATQLVSPIVWSNYALILLLPVAWLLDRRQWWAAAIPLVHVWVLIPFVPIWTYTVAFYATFIALLVVGWRSRNEVEEPPPVRARAAEPSLDPAA